MGSSIDFNRMVIPSFNHLDDHFVNGHSVTISWSQLFEQKSLPPYRYTAINGGTIAVRLQLHPHRLQDQLMFMLKALSLAHHQGCGFITGAARGDSNRRELWSSAWSFTVIPDYLCLCVVMQYHPWSAGIVHSHPLSWTVVSSLCTDHMIMRCSSHARASDLKSMGSCLDGCQMGYERDTSMACKSIFSSRGETGSIAPWSPIATASMMSSTELVRFYSYPMCSWFWPREKLQHHRKNITNVMTIKNSDRPWYWSDYQTSLVGCWWCSSYLVKSWDHQPLRFYQLTMATMRHGQNWCLWNYCRCWFTRHRHWPHLWLLAIDDHEYCLTTIIEQYIALTMGIAIDGGAPKPLVSPPETMF